MLNFVYFLSNEKYFFEKKIIIQNLNKVLRIGFNNLDFDNIRLKKTLNLSKNLKINLNKSFPHNLGS